MTVDVDVEVTLKAYFTVEVSADEELWAEEIAEFLKGVTRRPWELEDANEIDVIGFEVVK